MGYIGRSLVMMKVRNLGKMKIQVDKKSTKKQNYSRPDDRTEAAK